MSDNTIEILGNIRYSAWVLVLIFILLSYTLVMNIV